MTKVESRPATPEDIKAFYGSNPSRTIRAIVFLIDGEPRGVGGIKIEYGQFLAFSEIKPGVNLPDITIWRCAKIVMQMVKKLGVPVYAIADGDYANSARWLKKLGFVHEDSRPEGEVFKWQH